MACDTGIRECQLHGQHAADDSNVGRRLHPALHSSHQQLAGHAGVYGWRVSARVRVAVAYLMQTATAKLTPGIAPASL